MKSSHLPCEEMRRDALAHLSGETSVLEKRRFDAHLERCETCRASVEAVSSMLETARAKRFLPTAGVRDKMLESILSAIEDRHLPSVRESQRSAIRMLPRSVAVAAIAAALAAMVTAVVFKWPGSEPAVQSIADVPASFVSNEPSETKTPAQNVNLGVSSETRYTIDFAHDACQLNLERGRLWIRFKPSPDVRRLIVSGPELAVRVIGTVLVVAVDPDKRATTVGVLEGKVKVTPDEGDSVLLSSGDVRRPTGRVVSMESHLKEQAAKWLADLPETHAVMSPEAVVDQTVPNFDKASSARDDQGAGEDKETAKVNRLSDLYVVAEGQMQKGQYPAAAKTLEHLIKAGPKSARADTARLELAQIYTRQLDLPKRAVIHLETYLDHHPSGRKSDLVRKRLCRLSTDRNVVLRISCQ